MSSLDFRIHPLYGVDDCVRWKNNDLFKEAGNHVEFSLAVIDIIVIQFSLLESSKTVHRIANDARPRLTPLSILAASFFLRRTRGISEQRLNFGLVIVDHRFDFLHGATTPFGFGEVILGCDQGRVFQVFYNKVQMC